MRARLIYFAFFFVPLTVNAQMERTIYHVFEVDSVETVELTLAGIPEVHVWAGNTILVETNIQLWEASPEILKYLIEKGRYDVVADTTGAKSRTIRTKEPNRKPLKNKYGVECLEIATAKVFVPDTFIVADDRKRLTRKQDK